MPIRSISDSRSPLDGGSRETDAIRMWGIVLIDAAGCRLDELVFHGPIEAIREGCRRHLEARPDAAQARLMSPDGLLDYVYPEPAAG